MLLHLGNQKIEEMPPEPIDQPGNTEEQIEQVKTLKKKFRDLIQGKRTIGKYGNEEDFVDSGDSDDELSDQE